MTHALFLAALFSSPSGPELVEKAVEAHGSRVLSHARLSFSFRERRYEAERAGGRYSFQRSATQDGRTIVDTLTNDGVSRSVDGLSVKVPNKAQRGLSESINSVVYFASLPHALMDPAVRARSLESTTIRGRTYDVLEVTFIQDGGGTDFDDRFVYWIDNARGTIDYLAYSYTRNGGGVRFRVAKNPRSVAGVRIQDYANYEAALGTKLESLAARFEGGQLSLLSEIKTENPCVTLTRARTRHCS